MGLFIGASLLTILEILDYLCEVGGPGPQLGERGRSQATASWGGVQSASSTAAPQVFWDRVLGRHFWNRKHPQRPSSANLVTAPRPPALPSPLWVLSPFLSGEHHPYPVGRQGRGATRAGPWRGAVGEAPSIPATTSDPLSPPLPASGRAGRPSDPRSPALPRP